jgi:CheY-like chemotaxis protein
MYLPVTAGETAADVREEEIISGTGTILLVDDEELIRITAKRMLESMGYSVLTAENGLEGIRIFRDAQAQIDTVILDMIMPVMGGREAFEKMREIDSSVRVIISSGFAGSESAAELKKLGISDFVRKPFRQAELSRIVAGSLSGS